MGTIVVGVQGNEAQAQHPTAKMTIGELARKHELGIGVPQRSFLAAWFDSNKTRLQAELKDDMQAVLKGKQSRKKVLAARGYKWTEEVRKNIDADGVVGPSLAPSTIQRKGHHVKLLGLTYTLRNSITYKLFLPQKKSIRNTAQRAAARGQ
jgi:hypothetical protein